ncbi:hypothetical protein [uncultured Jatrophihabitans sp.]|uniref:hypothetical protein n=1 Tax=uncultured Jatrophihabitans sp. TaxID=1610747 RepID=UPI0035C99C34
MDSVLAWCAFFGAWLLVAGPIYQAAIELRDEDIERDDIAAAAHTVDRPARVSPWWWLLPPVHILLRRRRNRAYRREVFDQLTAAQVEAFVSFMNKATGWLFVAGGALLLAVNETWELREREEWPIAVFWVVLVVLAFACAANTAVRMQRGQRMIDQRRTPD